MAPDAGISESTVRLRSLVWAFGLCFAQCTPISPIADERSATSRAGQGSQRDSAEAEASDTPEPADSDAGAAD
jgi:hypothetical protein